jgi:hypothetical protein
VPSSLKIRIFSTHQKVLVDIHVWRFSCLHPWFKISKIATLRHMFCSVQKFVHINYMCAALLALSAVQRSCGVRPCSAQNSPDSKFLTALLCALAAQKEENFLNTSCFFALNYALPIKLSVGRGWTCISTVRGYIISVKIITFCSIQNVTVMRHACCASLFTHGSKIQDMRSAVYVILENLMCATLLAPSVVQNVSTGCTWSVLCSALGPSLSL